MDGNAFARAAAGDILAAYEEWVRRFGETTARARDRFERRDWHAAQRDAADRLALYRAVATAAAERVRALGGENAAAWPALKARYAALVADRVDRAPARTFLSSVSRLVLRTVGVEPAAEFTADEEVSAPPGVPRRGPPVFDTHFYDGDAASLVERILAATPWSAPWRDRAADVARVAARIDARVHDAWGSVGWDAAEVVRAPFYRNKGAYVVGRLRCEGRVLPLILPVLHEPEGLAVDAALLTEDEASVVFGFSWSYFRVDAPDPEALVDFLAAMMPAKRRDELFTAIGLNKHGKTVFYRTLLQHLEASGDRLVEAEGEEGLVMLVFALPGMSVVFKVIRDAATYPKRTTRAQVLEKYRLVFGRDRVGRLADAQEFERLELRRDAFDPALLDKLAAAAGRTVSITGDRVVLGHVYTERQVTPLNLHLRRAAPEDAREAVVDYGQAIKDLAAANIFPGDMLLKNFGVSRHGRVICYDYDELSLLTDCVFRSMPAARYDDDAMEAEPWFPVGEHDVFPEEFDAFLVPGGELRDAFLAAHAELLTVDYWQDVQRRVAAGELVDVFPYRSGRRFRGRD
ncbi:MAG TPA: bifunctional isocitrate dehydrogenase kinase/phosphatase [Gemmatimonadaceae bacterium]|nr:bifunctional isocitrate dehydrogenase kinase/phosphatase [Gemmatimonadaceae bacterium]